MTVQTPAFSAATAVTPVGDGRYVGHCDISWSAPRGPNGGYLMAFVLRAMLAELDDPDKAPRSLTCHYASPPQEGPIHVDVVVQRVGRAMTTMTATLSQDGRPCVLAIGAFGVDLATALTYDDHPMPQVRAPEELRSTPYVEGVTPPILQHLDTRGALGPRLFSEADVARTGGWIGLKHPEPVDVVAVAFYTDGWIPAPYTRLSAPSPAPTIDLTVHFRHRVPVAGVDPLEPLLIEVTSSASAEGYSEEDTRLWTRDGTLVAQSRQLALLRP